MTPKKNLCSKNAYQIKNGSIVLEDQVVIGNIHIENERIIQIERFDQNTFSNTQSNINNDNEIDATGKIIFPGGIDAHTHMNLPVMGTSSCDDFSTGSLGALNGGVTTIIDFANQEKGHSALDAIDKWHQKADGKTYCDYSFHVSITDLGKAKNELKAIVEQGIKSFKTFTAYDALRIDLSSLKEIIKIANNLNAIVTVHAENWETITNNISCLKQQNHTRPYFHHKSREENCEISAITDILNSTIDLNPSLYFVHVSTSESVHLISEFKKKHPGASLFIETCPQYLLLDNSKYSNTLDQQSAQFILSPPLRSKDNVNNLEADLFNYLIDVVATDHCPFLLKDKYLNISDFTKIPNGLPGVENRMELMYHLMVNSSKYKNKEQSLIHFAELNATNPAKIFGLYPTKGAIKVGADADLVIFDPKKEKIIDFKNQISCCDYSPYQGTKIKGSVVTTILRGNVIFDQGKLVNNKINGKFISR